MAKILVWAKEPGSKAKHVNISVSLENLSKWVGGKVAEATFCTDMHILYNEDMVFSDLKYNCSIASQMFFGNIILIGVKNGEYADCTMTADELRRFLPQLMKE